MKTTRGTILGPRVLPSEQTSVGGQFKQVPLLLVNRIFAIRPAVLTAGLFVVPCAHGSFAGFWRGLLLGDAETGKSGRAPRLAGWNGRQREVLRSEQIGRAPMNNDAHQLSLAMFTLALAAVILVTGQLYMEYRGPRSTAAATSVIARADQRDTSYGKPGAKPKFAER